MAGKHLRLFVACGTGRPFARLLAKAAELHGSDSVELFVQRGPETEAFRHLPGDELIARQAFAQRMDWADLVLCHAGAGTLYEAFSHGHRPLVMPRLARFGEHVNDHQVELAQALARRYLATTIDADAEWPALLAKGARRGAKPDLLAAAAPLSHAVAEALRASHGPKKQAAPLTALLGLSRAGLARVRQGFQRTSRS